MSDLLLNVALAAVGVFVGAMLTEGAILVPYWRSLSAEQFFVWYAANDKRLLDFFGPVTTAALVAAGVGTAAAFSVGHSGRWPACAAFVLIGLCTALFPLYFRNANARFSAGDIPVGELPDALAQWHTWHRRRTALALVALGLSAIAALP